MPDYLNFPITLLATILFFFVARYLLNRQLKGSDSSLVKQIVLFFIMLGGFVAVIVSLPGEWIKPEIKNAILSFTGVIISAAFALSSTSLLGNAFAGLMIRAIRGFKGGDFIKVNEHFGRVSERGLFHVEIQTEDGRLTTLPNLYLVTNPVEAIRSKKPWVCSEVSLGYDISRKKIETALKDGAERAGLKEAFVYILSLRDFSVVYRVHGQLKDFNEFLTAQSRLNGMVMDALHDADIEIVSPTFMNQRQISKTTFIPEISNQVEEEQEDKNAEEKIFDKAKKAESLEKKMSKLEEMKTSKQELEKSLKETESTEEKEKIEHRLNRIQKFIEDLTQKIEEEKAEMKKND